MKIDEIQVGQEYWTRVSGEPVLVRAVRIVHKRSFGWRGGDKAVRRVEVVRVDNGKLLPKARSAAALHRTRGPWDLEPNPRPRRVRLRAYFGGHGSDVGYYVAARSAKEAASLINALLPRGEHLTPRWVHETATDESSVVMAEPGVVFSKYGAMGELKRVEPWDV